MESVANDPGFNNFLSQTMGGLDSAMKKYIPPDKEDADKINKQREEIKSDQDKIAFPQAPPTKQNTDPMQAMGSAAGWIATLGSLLTKHPLESALNASAGVINAAKAGDQQAYDASMEKWKANDQLIKDQQEFITKKLQNAKSDAELKVQADALGMPGLSTLLRTPGGGKMYTEMYLKMASVYDKYKDTVRDDLSVKMETAAYVRDRVEEAKRANPNITPQEIHKIELQAQGEAARLRDKKNTDAPESKVDIDSLKPNDIIPGTNLSKASIDKAVEALHTGATYASQGISTRTTKNPERDAVKNRWAEKYPDDNPAITQLEYDIRKHAATSLGSQESKLKLSDNLLKSSLPSMMESASKLGLDSSVDWNKLVNEAKRRFSSEDFKNFQTQLRAVASDYAQFIGRGRQTVHSDEEALKILNQNEGMTSLKGFVSAVTTERQNVEKGMKDTEQDITGKKDAGSKKDDSNVRTLSNGTKAYKHSDGDWYDRPE